jgi:hypothetical protein
MRLRFNAEGVGFSKERHLASALKNGPPDNGGLATHGTPDAHQATRSIACMVADHGAKFRREVQRLLRILICPFALRSGSGRLTDDKHEAAHAKDGGQGSTLARALRKWRSSRMAVIILARRGESLCGRRCAATTSGERRALCTVWPGFPTSTGGENAGPERRRHGGSP